ncbi:hypothetical protein E2562_017301 [Oryza meyeriana var. granulata]|uniref:Uncharacterized protein n=1 Tax=Oryza meyeriana var. granulata TaxID=110450 RepID=A0A6G1EM96_9ORYZ|nr:hypothetical protein E2562_017301 [Oryza meyeriana var. granulata]
MSSIKRSSPSTDVGPVIVKASANGLEEISNMNYNYENNGFRGSGRVRDGRVSTLACMACTAASRDCGHRFHSKYIAKWFFKSMNNC